MEKIKEENMVSDKPWEILKIIQKDKKNMSKSAIGTRMIKTNKSSLIIKKMKLAAFLLNKFFLL